jgi:hypothetical protein
VRLGSGLTTRIRRPVTLTSNSRFGAGPRIPGSCSHPGRGGGELVRAAVAAGWPEAGPDRRNRSVPGRTGTERFLRRVQVSGEPRPGVTRSDLPSRRRRRPRGNLVRPRGGPAAGGTGRHPDDPAGGGSPGPPLASRLVALAADPVDVAHRIRRPVPDPPSREARRGSDFHRWLEQRFSRLPSSTWTNYPGLPTRETRMPTWPRCEARFLASVWASLSPVAVEVPVETPVAGVVVRGRSTRFLPGADGRWQVVDWKTGVPAPEPAPQSGGSTRVYRLAWSRLQQVSRNRSRRVLLRRHRSDGEAGGPAGRGPGWWLWSRGALTEPDGAPAPAST